MFTHCSSIQDHILKARISPIFASFLLLASLFVGQSYAGQSPPTQCSGQGVELQVLGSGGPELQDKRASSSYLIWHNGKAKVLVDMGGGSALRFGESGANIVNLDVVLFSHMHADHTADFPALIKSSYFEDRTQPLPIYGPLGNQSFPNTVAFVNALFGPKGAYPYLSYLLLPNNASYTLQPHNVALAAHEIKPVFNQNGIQVRAAEVIHGSVPALAWRIDIAGKSIVFSGDTNGDNFGNNDNLARIARSANILVAHNAVPEGATGVARRLHMTPSVIGNIAKQAQASTLVLSHRMLRTLGKEQQTLKAINKHYSGNMVFANDLDCFAIETN